MYYTYKLHIQALWNASEPPRDRSRRQRCHRATCLSVVAMEAWDDSDECIIVSASEPWPSLPACVHARRRLHGWPVTCVCACGERACVCMRRACMCVRRRLDAPAFVRARRRRDECKRCSIRGPRRLPVCVCCRCLCVRARAAVVSPCVCVHVVLVVCCVCCCFLCLCACGVESTTTRRLLVRACTASMTRRMPVSHDYDSAAMTSRLALIG